MLKSTRKEKRRKKFDFPPAKFIEYKKKQTQKQQTVNILCNKGSKEGRRRRGVVYIIKTFQQFAIRKGMNGLD